MVMPDERKEGRDSDPAHHKNRKESDLRKDVWHGHTTKTYNRLMNTYGEVCTDLEKPTLRSMRDVESAANMFYYTED